MRAAHGRVPDAAQMVTAVGDDDAEPILFHQ
ncbi:hypothetical protein AZ54_20090 [Xanthomonas oryzae pv. oryzae PXO86]|nr:hypothetical protein AZ54_20090 [Xanthomonas oryzae pv. oryzae PXO86]